MKLFLTLGVLFMAVAASPESEPRTLTLVWHDAYNVFPVRGLERLRNEVERLFASRGMRVRLHAPRSGENLRSIPEPRVNGVVIPRDGATWGLGPDTMAAAIGERGGQHNIFVFFPGVRRTLGHQGKDASPRELAEMARALARILAHEIVHVLAPDRGHAGSGLMSGQLRRRELLDDGLELDEPSLSLAREGLESWGSGGPEVVASSQPPPPWL